MLAHVILVLGSLIAIDILIGLPYIHRAGILRNLRIAIHGDRVQRTHLRTRIAYPASLLFILRKRPECVQLCPRAICTVIPVLVSIRVRIQFHHVCIIISASCQRIPRDRNPIATVVIRSRLGRRRDAHRRTRGRARTWRWAWCRARRQAWTWRWAGRWNRKIDVPRECDRCVIRRNGDRRNQGARNKSDGNHHFLHRHDPAF